MKKFNKNMFMLLATTIALGGLQIIGVLSVSSSL